MTKGLYIIDDSLYNNAVTKYVENNRCVLGWNLRYDVKFDSTTYHNIQGIDIVPGDYIELAKAPNPIRLKLQDKLDSISIKKKGTIVTIEMM